MVSPKMQEKADDYNVLNFDGLNRLAYEKAIHQEDLPYFKKISGNVMHEKYKSSRCWKITESLIQHSERSELRSPYRVSNPGLPDQSVLIGQKCQNSKNPNATFLSSFQTL